LKKGDVAGFSDSLVMGSTYWPITTSTNKTGIANAGARITRGVEGTHQGIDFAPEPVTGNKQIVSFADGTVVYCNITPIGSGYGTLIAILHQVDGKTYVSLYGHSDISASPAKGAGVNGGKVISTMSNKGQVYSTTGGDGTHLHFELRIPKGKKKLPEKSASEQTWYEYIFGQMTTVDPRKVLEDAASNFKSTL
jgi:murein DD-endopeptidase MepM/ murein hydrolase activator NlpD